MKKRKITIISFILCMLFALAFSVSHVKAETTTNDWTRYQNSETNNGVTNRPGPTDEKHAVLLWENNLDLPSSAKTPPLIVGDKVFVAGNKNIYCLDKKTGKQLKVSENLTGEIGFGLHPMVYAKGNLFVMTGGSGMVRVEAFSANTLKKLWSSEGVAGAVYSPLSYHEINGKGYLFTGTFQGTGQTGYYFCVAAEDNEEKTAGQLMWKNEYTYGFYWDGAYVTDNYMVFASENSESYFGTKDDSSLYVVNPITGAEIDRINNLKGNIRNTISYDKGYIYVATMTGRLYQIAISDEGIVAKPGEEGFSYIDLGGPIRTTTIIHNNRIYVGVGDVGGLDDPAGVYYYAVLDGSQSLDKNSIIYTVPVNGNPTGSPILSRAEESENGTVYLYFACNREPGGIYYITDKDGQTSGEVKQLFVPREGKQEYCISPLALDADGTIYYKNDSDYVMAVAPKLIQDVEVTPVSGVQWDDQRFEAGVKTYNLTVTDSVSSLQFDVEKISGDTDVSWKFIVDGKEQDSNTVALTGETTKVEFQVTRKAITQSYYFHIYKVTAQNTSLSLLYFGTNLHSGDNLLPPIEAGKTEYSVDLRKTSVGEAYLWIKTLHSNASVLVYAVENVKDPYTDKELKKGQELDRLTIEQLTGEYKFAVNPVDSSQNTVVRVSITSKDGSKTQDYQVRFIRTDTTQNVTPQPGTQQPSGTTVSNQPTAQSSTNVNIPKPKKVSGLKAKKSKKKVTLTWKKVSGASGYQIILAKDKKFKKSKKQINISKASTCKKQIKLTAKTKYARVRAYVKKNRTTVYGAYSKTLKIN